MVFGAQRVRADVQGVRLADRLAQAQLVLGNDAIDLVKKVRDTQRQMREELRGRSTEDWWKSVCEARRLARDRPREQRGRFRRDIERHVPRRNAITTASARFGARPPSPILSMSNFRAAF